MVSARLRAPLIAVALIAIFTAQSFFASLQKSPTSDEPAHIAAGLSYLETGIFHINIQHPPLIKELSAAALVAAGVHYPRTAEAMDVVKAPPNNSGREWQVGDGIIASGGADRVMFWARLPMILVAALLGVALFLFGRKVAGEAAALGAVFLYAFDPNALGHSYLVTTDIGVAAFSLLFLLALWTYLEQPTRARLIRCGLAMGLMLSAKYSAVFLVPMAAVLLLAAAVRREPAAMAAAAPARARKGRAQAAPAPRRQWTVDRAALRRFAGAFACMGAIAWLVAWALFFFHGGPLIYLEGVERVNADHNPNFVAYLAGDLQPRFTWYFAWCYLLKEPLAAILLAASGAWLLVRSRGIPALGKLFVVLPPAAIFAACTWRADDLGIRYLMPALPFAWLPGGMALAALARSARRAGRAAAAALGDSNVDWGQGLKQLKAWLDRHAARRPIYLACFVCVPPETYGVHATIPDLSQPPRPGVYVISSHFEGSVPALGRKMQTPLGYWLPRVRPTAIVGHAYYIYDFGGAQ